MNQIWFFENIDLYNLLCPHKMKEYTALHQFSKFKKFEYIYLQGDLARNFFLISKGRVKIGFWNEDGEEIVLSYLSKGEIFGENVVINQNLRHEFAQAMDHDTELCPISTSKAEDLMRANTNFSIGIVKFIGSKLKKFERKYQIMLFRNTKTRFVEFIKDLQEDTKYSTLLANEEVLINLPFTQSEVAKLIGTSRPTLNIIISELQDEDFLQFKRGKLILKKKFLLEF
jgi:CRP-like cAMP-binding protein